MANTINYASKYQSQILDIYNQNTLCAPFITTAVEWTGAKTFHFTAFSVSGFKNHSRTPGYNAGDVTETDKTYTLEFDRDIEFFIDKADVDESNYTASLENVQNVFYRTQASPEMDARFFSVVATKAVASSLSTSTAIASYNVGNVFTKIKELMKKGKLRLYKQRGTLVGYISTDLMDLLERSTELAKRIELTSLTDDGLGIKTRVASIDGVPLIEVIDEDRFYDKFDFSNGFAPVEQSYDAVTLTVGDSLVGLYSSDGAGNYTLQTSGTYASGTYYAKTVGAYKINVLFACVETTNVVPKISSIYMFAPGQHTKGDGYLYQNRTLQDTIVKHNGLNGNIDSIAVDLDTTEHTGA